MRLKIMSVAYERPIPMRILIDCFLVQTNPNWELTIIHDGKASEDVLRTVSLYKDPRIIFQESPERYGIYGHPNRKRFLENIETNYTDFILLTNDDNYYVPVFVDKVLTKCGSILDSPKKWNSPLDVGMVYFDTVHSHFQYNVLKTEVRVDHIDVGSFVVRADVAKAVGFANFAFNGDGYYAVDCAHYCLSHGLGISYIPKPLFIHN